MKWGALNKVCCRNDGLDTQNGVWIEAMCRRDE